MTKQSKNFEIKIIIYIRICFFNIYTECDQNRSLYKCWSSQFYQQFLHFYQNSCYNQSHSLHRWTSLLFPCSLISSCFHLCDYINHFSRRSLHVFWRQHCVRIQRSVLRCNGSSSKLNGIVKMFSLGGFFSKKQ